MTKIDNFDFWDQIFPKSVFPVQNRTSEHFLQIQHI